MPNIVDPGPWIRQRIAEETAPLRAELAGTSSPWTRLRLRWRIWRVSARIRAMFSGHGPVRW